MEKVEYQNTCISGVCNTDYKVVYLGDTLNPNSNNHWELEYNGLNYFQVCGNLSKLNDQYVINGVPLTEANFDSDYCPGLPEGRRPCRCKGYKPDC